MNVNSRRRQKIRKKRTLVLQPLLGSDEEEHEACARLAAVLVAASHDLRRARILLHLKVTNRSLAEALGRVCRAEGGQAPMRAELKERSRGRVTVRTVVPIARLPQQL